MKDLLVREFNGKKLTAINYKGEPHFIGKEVCDILEIDHITKFCSDLNSNQKVNLTGEELRSFKEFITDVKNGHQSVNILKRCRNLILLTESGLYKACFRSRKPEAEKFQNWVCNDVLPEIRKTGNYVSDQNKIFSDKALGLIAQNLTQNTNDINSIKQGLNQFSDRLSSIENKVLKSLSLDSKERKKRRIKVVFSFLDKVRSEAVKLKIQGSQLVENIIRDDIEKNSYIQPINASFRISDYPAKTKVEIFLTDYEYKMVKTLAWYDEVKIGHYIDKIVIDQIDQKIVKLKIQE